MNNIKILDATLRDGGYCNQWNFGIQNIKKIVNGLIQANVDIIECGLLCEGKFPDDITKFGNINQFNKFLPKKKEERLFVGLMNYGEFDIDKLPEYDGTSIDGIRVAFHRQDREKGLALCKKIKNKNYKVFVQPMVSLEYSDKEFIEMIETVNDIEPYAFYIVDSFGRMKRKDVVRLFYLVEHNLNKAIMIGFHGHNNLQLAFANAQTLIDINTDCSLIIDSCIMGMGRGAGNLNTELFIDYINDDGNYHVEPILKVIDDVINIFHTKKSWGFTLPNYLSAIYNLHPNYATFLSEKNTLTVQNINELLSLIGPTQKTKFDQAYIENLYLKHMEKPALNDVHSNEFKSNVLGKRVLLIAPGLSSQKEAPEIKSFADYADVISISINFEYQYFETDYLYVSNMKRYEKLNVKSRKKRLIVTSNIDTDCAYLYLNYAELLCEIDAIKDNAAMMLIKYLVGIGVNDIYLAGLDGYSYDINKNYAEGMQLAAENTTLEKMNEGIKKTLHKFSEQCHLHFLTNKNNLYI